MTRVELRLELMRIAHHPAQGTETTLEIVRQLEQGFADLTLDNEAPPKPEPKSKAKG